MVEIKLAHISDMHLGSFFSGLTPEKAKLRYDELIFTNIQAIKNASDCDILLLSGDVFDSGECLISVADAFLDAVRTISGTKVYYCCGNHDSYNTDIIKYCLKNSPDNLHIFPPDKISFVTIEDLNVRIYGVSFSNEYQYVPLIETMPECDEYYLNILCMHADLHSKIYNPLSVTQLERSNLDYVALGHVHSFDGIHTVGKTTYAYSGIVEGRGFDECGEKGFIKGVISKRYNKFKFYPISKRKYIDEIIDISDFKTEYDLLDVMNSICESNNNICRFTFVGINSFDKYNDLKRLSEHCIAFQCICNDKTRTDISIEDYVNLPGLLGACAREAEKRYVNTETWNEKESIKKSFEILVNILENK